MRIVTDAIPKEVIEEARSYVMKNMGDFKWQSSEIMWSPGLKVGINGSCLIVIGRMAIISINLHNHAVTVLWRGQHDIILELQRARNITITLLPNDKESEEELALKMSYCKLI